MASIRYMLLCTLLSYYMLLSYAPLRACLSAMQANVEKIGDQVQQAEAAVEHEAEKLQKYDADQTALKDRCCL